MYTESDLRSAIDELAGDAPDTYTLLRVVPNPSPRPRPSPRRRLLAAGAAVVVVLALAIGVAIHASSTTTEQTSGQVNGAAPSTDEPCAAGPATTFPTLTMTAVPGIVSQNTLNLTTACSGYASLILYVPPQGGLLGSVTLFARGVFDAATVAGTAPAKADGIVGYPLNLPDNEGVLGGINSDGSPVACTNPARPKVILASCPQSSAQLGTDAALAWRYAANSWGVIRIFSGDPGKQYSTAKQLQIAAAVEPKSTPPILPMKLTYLPDGTRPVIITETAGDGFSTVGQAGDVELGAIGQDPACPAGLACAPVVSINVMSDTEATTAPGYAGQHLTINGHPATIVTPTHQRPAPHVLMATGRWYLDMSATLASGITAEELVHIAQGMSFAASPTKLSTWFPTQAALPQ